MKQTSCTQETAVIKAVRSGEYNEPLKAHIAGCAACREASRIAHAMLSLTQVSEEKLAVPEAGLLWWKSQLAQRLERAERAQRPLEWLEALSEAAIPLGIAAGFAWMWMRAAGEWPALLGRIWPQMWKTAWSVMTASPAMLTSAALPAAVVIVSALVVAAYPAADWGVALRRVFARKSKEELKMRNLFLIAAVFIALPIYAQDFHWNGAVAQGKTIRIKGINGAIAAQASPSNEVIVNAKKIVHWGDPNDLRIEVRQSDDGVTICAVYADNWESARMRDFFQWLFSSPEPSDKTIPCVSGMHIFDGSEITTDFTVQVPAGVRFAGSTVNGKVDAVSLASDVDARTVNGSVRLSTTGNAQGASVNGSIDVSMGSFNRPAHFSTVNGSIRLEVPGDIHARLAASTVNGSISTDFPLTVQGVVGKTVEGTIAGGGPELDLKTVNGSIGVKRKL